MAFMLATILVVDFLVTPATAVIDSMLLYYSFLLLRPLVIEDIKIILHQNK